MMLCPPQSLKKRKKKKALALAFHKIRIYLSGKGSNKYKRNVKTGNGMDVTPKLSEPIKDRR